ncbi:hypothetical protein Glove_26g122 [Diversispora epigaea]|uniref:TFIIS N-terminal domain-containing protein n=1 Tax=Diversispora epigaea TaxID=1348612 RepID=A0A397JMX1_9GLOM|nr:hypothetical protein Glove_26g122 [Diversispora epigaea]
MEDYEEIFGDGAEELSDVVDDFSDFDYDHEKASSAPAPKQKQKSQRDLSVSPPRRTISEGDRDEDDLYTPQPTKRIKRKLEKRPRKAPIRKKKYRDDDGDIDEDEVIAPTAEMAPLMESRQRIERDFDEIMPKKKGKSKAKGIDLDKYYDQAAEKLYQQMVEYADYDYNTCQDQKPTTKKLDNLQYVVDELSKPFMLEALMESNILDAIRYWLEPLPDRSLPNITIVEQLMGVLNKFPIITDHLLSSKVGRIVYFYDQSPRISDNIKQLASNIVAKWSRAIFGISVDYKDKNFKRVEFDPELMAEVQSKTNYSEPNNIDERTPPKRVLMTSSAVHAQIPQPAAFDYDIMPEVRLSSPHRGKRADDPYKHLKQTMARMRRGEKKRKI